MKILILGAGGQLGRALTNVLADEEILVADLPQCDITNFDGIREWLKNSAPDAVINAAAYTAVDESENNQETADLVNGEAVGNLAAICHDLKIALIHYSTDFVFDGTQDIYNEQAVPNPLSYYGKSKLLGEKLCLEKNPDACIIRTAWLYGLGGNNFINKIIERAKKETELKVVDDQIGCPTFAKDLAVATRDFLREKHPGGIYHLTNDGSCSRYELALKIVEFLKYNTKVIPVKTTDLPETPAKRPAKVILQNTKLPKLRPWAEAVVDYLSLLPEEFIKN